MLLTSAAVAVGAAAVEQVWERRESPCCHELSNLSGSLETPRLA